MSQTNNPTSLPILIENQTVFEESLVKIERDLLSINKRPPYHYYTLTTHPCAVCIIALTSTGTFVLNEEYRHPTKQFLLSCPGGFIDANEDPLHAAKRELLEETGFDAQSYTLIGSAFPYAGFSGQKTIYIWAQHAFLSGPQSLDHSEIISPCLLTQEELNQRIDAGTALDGTLCTALYFLSRKVSANAPL